MLPLPLRFMALPLAILLVVGSFILYKEWQRKKNYEASYVEWEIRRHLQEGDGERAKKLIEEGLKKGGAFKPLILSHSLQLSSGGQESKIIREVLSNLRDEEERSLYTERLAFAYLKEGQKEKSLQVLNSIGKERFNYYSAQVLRAQILLEVGKKEEARKVLEQVIKEARGTYWSNLAQVLLREVVG